MAGLTIAVELLPPTGEYDGYAQGAVWDESLPAWGISLVPGFEWSIERIRPEDWIANSSEPNGWGVSVVSTSPFIVNVTTPDDPMWLHQWFFVAYWDTAPTPNFYPPTGDPLFRVNGHYSHSIMPQCHITNMSNAIQVDGQWQATTQQCGTTGVELTLSWNKDGATQWWHDGNPAGYDLASHSIDWGDGIVEDLLVDILNNASNSLKVYHSYPRYQLYRARYMVWDIYGRYREWVREYYPPTLPPTPQFVWYADEDEYGLYRADASESYSQEGTEITQYRWILERTPDKNTADHVVLSGTDEQFLAADFGIASAVGPQIEIRASDVDAYWLHLYVKSNSGCTAWISQEITANNGLALHYDNRVAVWRLLVRRKGRTEMEEYDRLCRPNADPERDYQLVYHTPRPGEILYSGAQVVYVYSNTMVTEFVIPANPAGITPMIPGRVRLLGAAINGDGSVLYMAALDLDSEQAVFAQVRRTQNGWTRETMNGITGLPSTIKPPGAMAMSGTDILLVASDGDDLFLAVSHDEGRTWEVAA